MVAEDLLLDNYMFLRTVERKAKYNAEEVLVDWTAIVNLVKRGLKIMVPKKTLFNSVNKQDPSCTKSLNQS